MSIWSIFYDERELNREATIRKFRIVRREGSRDVSREIEHYSLPAILAVGYRVRSVRGTQFRQWATARLSEYLLKGFTMDDERLKNPPASGVPDYFDELLERIRDIRASERRMYLRVKEILALAADYQPHGTGDAAIFSDCSEQIAFCRDGQDCAGADCGESRCEPAEYGPDKLEGRRRAEERRHGREELLEPG